jgi:hypothetical protein
MKSAVLFATVATLVLSRLSFAQCPPGEVLGWEDEDYWHCVSPASPWEVRSLLEKAEPLLGEDWRYRKRLIDEVGSLKGTQYELGAKFDVTLDGQVTHFCSTAGQCKDDDRSVDCSGAVARGQLSACVVWGLCRLAFPELKQGLLGEHSNAAGIASFFYQHGAFIGEYSVSPSPGDLIFFRDSGKGNRRGITHVAIFLGDMSDGRKVVLHAVGKPGNKVMFEKLKPDSDLVSRIVGYGNVSKLVRSLGAGPNNR